MKKTAAFLTLVFLIATLFLFYYIDCGKYFPTWRDLEPATSLIKSFVVADMHKPVAAGLAIFWLSAFLLSLMVLREPSSQVIQQISSSETGELTRLEEKLALCEKERAELKQQTGDMQSQIQSLQGLLEKSKADAGKASAETQAQLQKQLDDLQQNLDVAAKNSEKTTVELKAALADKSRFSAENEALISKIEKTEQESKNARREAEKLSSQLKAANSDSEKKAEEIAGFRQQIDNLVQELKSAQANAKGGKEGIPPAAYQILYLFQKEGRLIDLLCEDISGLDDETLGGAIRPIHEGCRKLLVDRLILEHVLDEEEGSEVTVDEIDPEAIKLSGRVPSKGPYKGELIHRGWRLKECNLPELVDGWKGNVIAPAEIEIG